MNYYPNGLPTEAEEVELSSLPAFKKTSEEEAINSYSIIKNSFLNGKTRSIEFRRQQLLSLYKGLKKWYSHLIEAQVADFKARKESTADINNVMQEVADYLENLDEWTKPEYVKKPLSNAKDIVKIELEPYGTWLNIAPWNYPILLSLNPIIGSIAAGNCCIIKPSEIAPYSAAMVTKLIEDSLDLECYRVVNGDKDITTKLLNLKWDYIMYTGNGTVGRIVMEAASKNLTPITLELGGKNPVFIDESINDLHIVARRIVWGRFLNAGQICVSPDHVFIHPSIKDQFVDLVVKAIKEFYTENTRSNKDWPRIVNDKHVQRIANMLPKGDSPKEFGKIVYGGKFNAEDKYFEPTVITDLDPDIAPIMKDEIFGPVLPIITVESIEEAIKFVQKRDSPLALYIFSENNNYINKIKNQIPSGGMVVNDVIVHLGITSLPFGGVGASGIGSYNGRHSINEFSHKRSVLQITDIKGSEKKGLLRYAPIEIDTVLPLKNPHNLYWTDPSSSWSSYLINSVAATLGFIPLVIKTIIFGRKDGKNFEC